MITTVAQIAVLVEDYDEAIAFYAGKLGFLVVEDTPLPGKRWVRLRAPGGGGADLLLSKAADAGEAAAIGRQAGGRVLLFLHTDAFDADLARLRGLGVEVCEGPAAHAYGKVAVLKDLYGNRIDLIQPAAPAHDREFFDALRGRAAVRAALGHGSFLTLDFGAPDASWHLWIFCCGWELRAGARRLTHAEDDRAAIAPEAAALVGDPLAAVARDGAKTGFFFASGKVLATFPVDDAEQWLIYAPDGRVLTLAADGSTAVTHAGKSR